jgi:uncharacterized protein (DUF488 family)
VLREAPPQLTSKASVHPVEGISVPPNHPGKPVFTVGHGARSLEDFVDILSGAGVEVLVDIRRYPGSRRHPHFARESLAAFLPQQGIGYEWWGDAMGGRRSAAETSLERHGAWDNEAFRAYASYMDGSEFQEALQRLMEVSEGREAAIMCAESLWWRCHRRLVADALVARGRPVLHLGLGEPQAHALTRFCRVDENGLLAYDGKN